MYGKEQHLSKKEIIVLIKQAEQQGWRVSMAPGGHYKWMAPNGKLFFTSQTPSDHRALQNIKRDLRVNGFIFTPKKERRKNRG